ncbi:hypothetical protein ACQPXH_26830 [Nocardia sp. CA-135953]
MTTTARQSPTPPPPDPNASFQRKPIMKSHHYGLRARLGIALVAVTT